MKRRLFELLALLSLTLFAPSVCLWARGYWVGDRIYWSRSWLDVDGSHSRESAYWLLSSRGLVGVGHRGQRRIVYPADLEPLWLPFIAEPGLAFWWCDRPPTPVLTVAERSGGITRHLGFAIEVAPWTAPGATSVYRQWTAPVWSLCLVLAVLPGCWLHRYRAARRRFAQGLCRQCGYDLRASSQRCPECGSDVDCAGASV